MNLKNRIMESSNRYPIAVLKKFSSSTIFFQIRDTYVKSKGHLYLFFNIVVLSRLLHQSVVLICEYHDKYNIFKYSTMAMLITSMRCVDMYLDIRTITIF